MYQYIGKLIKLHKCDRSVDCINCYKNINNFENLFKDEEFDSKHLDANIDYPCIVYILKYAILNYKDFKFPKYKCLYKNKLYWIHEEYIENPKNEVME